MIAVLDETYPEFRKGTAYVVGAAVLTAEEDLARSEAKQVVAAPLRLRPFHWHQEGPRARDRMMSCLESVGAVAHVCVHYPTGRSRLEAARAAGLKTLIPRLIEDGTSRLVIEARGLMEDARDRAVILDTFNELQSPGAFAYDWETKAEPLVWLADAVCGAVREHLIDPDAAPHFDRLQNAGVIDQLIYTSGA